MTFSAPIYFNSLFSTPKVVIYDSDDNEITSRRGDARDDSETGFDLFIGTWVSDYSADYRLEVLYRDPDDDSTDITHAISFSTVAIDDVEVATLPAGPQPQAAMRGLTIGKDGEVIITRSKSDHSESYIEKLSADGTSYEVIAGSADRGRDDGPVSSATMEALQGVAADNDGNLYFASTPSTATGTTKSIRMLKDGEVSTIRETTLTGVGLYDVAVNPDGTEIYFFETRTFGTNFRVYGQDGEQIRTVGLTTTTTDIDFGSSPDSSPEQVRAVAFDATNNRVVFVVGSSLYSIPPDGDADDVEILVTEDRRINTFSVATFGGNVYYTTQSESVNGFTQIKRVSTLGTGDAEVYVGSDAEGSHDGDRTTAAIRTNSIRTLTGIGIVQTGPNAGTLYIINGQGRIVRVVPE